MSLPAPRKFALVFIARPTGRRIQMFGGAGDPISGKGMDIARGVRGDEGRELRRSQVEPNGPTKRIPRRHAIRRPNRRRISIRQASIRRHPPMYRAHHWARTINGFGRNVSLFARTQEVLKRTAPWK